jgi:hypothetical protein
MIRGYASPNGAADITGAAAAPYLLSGYERPVFPFRFALFTFGTLAFAAAAFGVSLSLLASLLALPFAAPAFLGLAAFGSAIGSATPSPSTRWVGAGGTGSGSGRSCASSSLLKATPSSRRPAPDGSVATTPSGSPSSFQASAASSSSLSLSLSSTSPARMASAIRPEFWRTAASILAAMSGFSFKNCFAFSRPCPMRWLS